MEDLNIPLSSSLSTDNDTTNQIPQCNYTISITDHNSLILIFIANSLNGTTQIIPHTPMTPMQNEFLTFTQRLFFVSSDVTPYINFLINRYIEMQLH